MSQERSDICRSDVLKQMRGAGSSIEGKSIRLEYRQFIHCNKRGKAEYMNLNASRLVILVMGK